MFRDGDFTRRPGKQWERMTLPICLDSEQVVFALAAAAEAKDAFTENHPQRVAHTARRRSRWITDGKSNKTVAFLDPAGYIVRQPGGCA